MADAEITANNLAYFGEPVYEYDIAQAIEDGYLAACEIQKGRVNLDDTGITKEEIIARNPVDAITGQPITAEQIEDLYQRTQYEDRILLPDRVLAMCQDLFNYLLETGGPEQKTIIFCARDRHADDVAVCLNNLYANWCADNGKQRLDYYAFKCTAASSGNDQLPDLRASSRSHFIATTVDLLTTGVDVPCVRNIVFFKYLKSPISFYQMVGRGTRIDAPTGKLMFRVYDYTDATRLFGEDFITKPTAHRTAMARTHRRPSAAGTDHQRRGLRCSHHRRRALHRRRRGRQGHARAHRGVQGPPGRASGPGSPHAGRLPGPLDRPAVAAGTDRRPGDLRLLADRRADGGRQGRTTTFTMCWPNSAGA